MKCLKNLHLNTPADDFFYQTAFPIQFAITIIGNALTLSVLLNQSMRNRANHLLAALAFADMAVFIFMLPTSLSAIQRFYESTTFRIIFAHTKTHFAALANWFSCAAIWIVLAVSAERLLIIKFPFRSLKQYHAMGSIIIISMILAFTLVLTCYHHFSYHCAALWVCNMTQIYMKCLPVTLNWTEFGLVPYYQPSDRFIFYINMSVIANAFVGVIIPVFIVAFLNVYLIRLLQIRTEQAKSDEVSFGPAFNNFCEQERKMTVTIVAIVTCFTVTQLPSAILFLYEKIISDAKTDAFAKASCITNFLVLTGKMLNVVLFCLTSATFRRKLFFTIHIWYRKFTCQQKNYLRHMNTLNRSATQKSSLFSTTSFQNHKFRRYSNNRGWSSAQINDKIEIMPVIAHS
ncbi:putative G-protein coupled receptor [Dirofilaria immitis]